MRFAIKPREADEFVGCLGETIVSSPTFVRTIHVGTR